MVASVANVVMLLGVLAGLGLAVFFATPVQRLDSLWSAATLVGMAWVLLTALSARQMRAANQAAAFMAAGRADLAEQRLKHAIHQFSLYRRGKLMVCHALAVIAHGRKDYHVAAELCDGIVSTCGHLSRRIVRLCRILLADCRLALGDNRAAGSALGPINLGLPDLNLVEQLMLLPVELSCQIGRGDYAAAAANLGWKIRRAELLDSPKAALVHALLARACREIGRTECAELLRRKAELYHDMKDLQKEYALLGEQLAAPVAGTEVPLPERRIIR